MKPQNLPKKQNQSAKSGKKPDASLIALWILAGILALGLVVFGVVMASRAIYNAYLDTGNKYREDVIFESEHHSLNAAMLSFRFHENIRSGLYGSDYTDPELLKNTASPVSGMSLYEYYERILCEALLRDMRYAECASSSGVSLSDEENAWISARLQGVVRSAASSDPDWTLDDSLSALYGRGVKMSDIEDLLRLETLAEKQRCLIELDSEPTDEEIADCLAHTDLSVYLRVDYYIVDFGNNISDSDSSAEKAVKLQLAREHADQLAQCSSETEFVAMAKEFLRQEFADDPSVTEDDLSEIFELDHFVEKEFPDLPDDAPASSKWLFSADRKTGDIFVEPDSPTVYFIARAPYSIDAPNDAYLVLNVAYNHYSSASAALAAFNAIIDLYEADPGEQSFRNLVSRFAENYVFRAKEGFYNNTADSSSFNSLITNFKSAKEKDAPLAPGTTGTLYGESGAYFIYYLGKNSLRSTVEARETVLNAKCYKRYEELAKINNITFHASKNQRSADLYKK